MQPTRPARPSAAPPHLAGAEQVQTLQDRVNEAYGAFGSRPQEDHVVPERAVLKDNAFKPTLRLIGIVLAASAFAWVLSHPNLDGPGAWASSFRIDSALIVLWAPALYMAMARRRLDKSLRIYLGLGLFIEAFSETMFRDMGEGGYWDTILWPANVAWFGTLKEFAGVPGASLSVFTLVSAGLLYRAIKERRADGREPPPAWAKSILYVFAGTLLALCVLGIARGGGIEPAFRQTIHLFQIPLVALLFLYALRVPEDLAAVGTIIVTTALARSLIVFFVYFAICVPNGITEQPGKPEWCTNHSDSVLFVTAILVLAAHAIEQRQSKATTRALVLGGVLILAILLNNRRLAFVSLGIAPLVMYLALKPSKRKRRVTALMALAVPLVAGYVLVGAESTSGSAFFKPAKAVMSVLDQKDTSSQSRDIENENLIYTLSQNPVLTTGFGHEYEYSPNNPPVDLSEVFKSFRLIAHNGVLWMWSLAGVFGFTLLWLVYPLTGTMAVRAYRAADTPLERSASLAALGAMVVCVIQIWGDQGFSSYMTILVFGVAFATAARLAARAG